MLPGLSCIIIDAERKAVDLLSGKLAILYPDLHISGAFTDWNEGAKALQSNKVDILLMDMYIGGKTASDLLKQFPDREFEVIFVTAHSEFALQAIKLSAVGYVLKPIDDFELSFAVNKALERIRKDVPNNPNVHGAAANAGARKIGIPNVKGIDYLDVNQVLYFESVNKYTKVVTKDFSIMSSYNLGEFKKILDEQVFFPIHRSFIININYVKRYETAGFVIMEDNVQIPVSKAIRAEFLVTFNKISRIAALKARDGEL
jgi:two-component system, LytTR family, response regulator